MDRSKRGRPIIHRTIDAKRLAHREAARKYYEANRETILANLKNIRETKQQNFQIR